MHKTSSFFKIISSKRIADNYQLLTLALNEPVALFNDIQPGQFVQIKIDNSPSTFLRRPISINDVNPAEHSITILVRIAGDGTRALANLPVGTEINLLWPLGNGFSTDLSPSDKVLLAGGGVGVAPLLYLGKKLAQNGLKPTFLLAARTFRDILLLERFAEIGSVAISTDDGSMGEHGLITANSILNNAFDMIYCCGPMPMMKAIAKICHERNINCEVSLENIMACGIGACLCCVEKTVTGNKCVCTEGPVFNINDLTW